MSERIVYLVQDVPGTKAGTPKINIVGAREYGEVVSLLPELSQIIFSPGPLIFKLRKLLKDFKPDDYLLLTGDPAIIGVACSIVSDITNGKYNRTCNTCLLYTSPSPRDRTRSRMPSSA